MPSMPKVLSQDEGSGIAGTANRPILASTAVGHRYRWKVDPPRRAITPLQWSQLNILQNG
jgi:hypothetical protein